MHLSGPENRTSPLCKSARGSASAWSSWTAVSWGRDSGVWDRGWAGGRHPFWGRGSNGCKSLTRSKLEEPFLWLLFPATSSPLSVERERSRRAPRWRPRRWNAGVFERIGVNNQFCQASARVARGWINSSGRLHGGRALVRDGRGKLLSFRECLFYFFHCHSGRLHGRLYGPCSNKHNSLCTRKRTGWKEVS